MPTFAELLKEYAARTGVSDAELARTLGVGRQTIFRWKEGLVVRPRHRDDVLRAAARLRLTAEERDGFLLAAGFAPVASTAVTSVATEPPPAARPQAEAASPTRRRPLLIAAAAVAVLAATGATAWAMRAAAPRARGAERLIILGGDDQVLPDHPASVMMGRIDEALRREIASGRLSGVRVARWPAARPDAEALARAQSRSAAIAIAVPDGPSGLMIQLGEATDTDVGRAMSLTLEADRPGDTDAVAHLLLAHAHTRDGQWDEARAALTQARASAPSPSLVAELVLESGLIDRLASNTWEAPALATPRRSAPP